MEDFKEKKVFYACLLTFLIVLFIPSLTKAASLYFSPSSGSYAVGSTFPINIYVSSTEQSMNAASGIISFPQDKLEVVSLSKSGSIFSLWVQEPTFSNSAGTITFEGIVLNPGFTGSSGKTIIANFKVRAAGAAILSFSSGSILANDGKGTNILTDLGNANFGLGGAAPPTVSEPIIPGTPQAPQIISLTHPDSEKWYSNKDPEFSWKLPSDVTGVSLMLTQSSTSNPGPISDGKIESKKFEDVEDGIWYFHIKFENKYGWGQITHYKIQIDTTPPRPFEIEVKEGKETPNPQPTLVFETTDEMSGIDYYEVKINQESLVQIKEKKYKLPVQSSGKHTIIIKAVDKAGNYTLAMTEINILLTEAPIITDYPKKLITGNTLSIKGETIPEATIKIHLQKEEKEIKTGETKSDKDGKWFYIETEPLEKGIYKIWAENIDSSGARSEPSEKVTIQVTPPVFIQIGKLAIDYLTTFITLSVLILVIIFGTVWSWQKIKRRKKVLGKEITEAEFALYQAFKNLKEKVERETVKLDGEPDLTEREKRIRDELKESLKASEKFIDKEIKDIKKELG